MDGSAASPAFRFSVDQHETGIVAIRGRHSSLNNFTVNGASAGTPEAKAGRVPLDVTGGELRLKLSRSSKCTRPDAMDAQGIGGTINVVEDFVPMFSGSPYAYPHGYRMNPATFLGITWIH